MIAALHSISERCVDHERIEDLRLDLLGTGTGLLDPSQCQRLYRIILDRSVLRRGCAPLADVFPDLLYSSHPVLAGEPGSEGDKERSGIEDAHEFVKSRHDKTLTDLLEQYSIRCDHPTGGVRPHLFFMVS